MALRDTLNKLMALQSLNVDIEQKETDKKKLHVDVKNQERKVEDVKKRLEKVRLEKIDNQKTADSLEIKINSLQTENKKFNVQLNTTKNQEEYDKIRNAILSNKADIERWEDQELATLQEVDALDKKAGELQEKLEAEEEKLRKIKKDVSHKTDDYERELQELEDRKEKLRAQIDDEILDSYDRLLASKGNNAVVKVRDRICLGCHTQLTKQTENELMRCKDIIYCHNCGRILVMDEKEKADRQADYGR
jgi:predicted  nucleic acid-binding Zn-ribbon protein